MTSTATLARVFEGTLPVPAERELTLYQNTLYLEALDDAELKDTSLTGAIRRLLEFRIEMLKGPRGEPAGEADARADADSEADRHQAPKLRKPSTGYAAPAPQRAPPTTTKRFLFPARVLRTDEEETIFAMPCCGARDALSG
ncbi:hypothetical protein MKEN_00805300 [Mycena kentingensis (nom. inval.)]|nr:hypothetical protein MKEN_00805300 [Mycena kentingensis (nom. inval.)]